MRVVTTLSIVKRLVDYVSVRLVLAHTQTHFTGFSFVVTLL